MLNRPLVVSGGNLPHVAQAGEVGYLPSVVTRDTTNVGTTITVNELMCDIYVRSGTTAAFTDTLPTGAAMDAAYPEAAVGDQWVININNKGAGPMTFAAGAGFTLVAGAPTYLYPGINSDCVIKKTGVATWTFEILNTQQRPDNMVSKDSSAVGNAIGVAELFSNFYQRSGPVGAFADTLPTGAAMDTNFAAITPIGANWLLELVNQGGGVMTITAAAGFTAVGVNTIAAGAKVKINITRTAANTWTYDILG